MTPHWECFIDPLLTTPESNSREHWHKKATRHTKQRDAIKTVWKATGSAIPNIQNVPIILYICRVAPRRLDHSDNLPCSLKSLVDEICNCLLPGYADGRADGLLKIKIAYAQAKGLPRQYAIKIKIFTCEVASADLTCCENIPDTQHYICNSCHQIFELL